jgi:Cys-rich protein (TIGR01571 family)
MNLSWCADEIPARVECSAFTVYFIFQIVFIVFGLFIRFIHWLILLIVTMKLRSYIRAKYHIPEKSCVGCEDFCCAFWCLPCAICQLARHTADYHKYSAACCTDTGLAIGTPLVV